MNKIKIKLIILIITICSMLNLHSSDKFHVNEIFYAKISLLTYNKNVRFRSVDCKLSYMHDKDIVTLYYKTSPWTVGIMLSKTAREELIKYCIKYADWNKKALQDEITIIKDMGTLPLEVYFRNQTHRYSGSGIIAYISFFSQSKKRHQLAIRLSRTVANQNKLISFNPAAIYLDADKIELFKKLIKDDFIMKEAGKIKKDREKEKREFQERYK